ncbi:MAG: hypothetical protein JNK45_20810 [Myxococcales bacterium]|nr:hypothetical protein [Myxococcales bacterium]
MLCAAAVMLGAPSGARVDAPKNAIAITPAVNAPRFGIGIGYDRAVHRLLSVGARFEYAIPRAGYAHLQGLTETLALTLWVPRAFRGVFAEASLGLAHSVLASQPLFRRTTIVPGLSAGLRWRFGKTFFAGASVGLRWGRLLRGDPAICTYSAACPATRTGPWVRAALDVGFAF